MTTRHQRRIDRGLKRERVPPPSWSPPRTSPQDTRAEDLVNRIRDHVVAAALQHSGVRAYVGGATAAAIDTSQRFTERLYWVIGAVVVLSFLLLMSVFRSLAVPLKAAVMNLLSIGAPTA